mmetsp:Transcript_111211/g.221184  ORF Transcript_111211/g.221184 Transcript_111211/m.221184 type:complete len:81 (+) Transcript_111211:664-906(+)
MANIRQTLCFAAADDGQTAHFGPQVDHRLNQISFVALGMTTMHTVEDWSMVQSQGEPGGQQDMEVEESTERCMRVLLQQT